MLPPQLQVRSPGLARRGLPARSIPHRIVSHHAGRVPIMLMLRPPILFGPRVHERGRFPHRHEHFGADRPPGWPVARAGSAALAA